VRETAFLWASTLLFGPIDPQFVINTATGPRQVAAFAILEQFELAKTECQDTAKLSAWLPMLSQYGPDFLVKSQLAINCRSRSSKTGWLYTCSPGFLTVPRRLPKSLAGYATMRT
jgi:hypothetical protein